MYKGYVKNKTEIRVLSYQILSYFVDLACSSL